MKVTLVTGLRRLLAAAWLLLAAGLLGLGLLTHVAATFVVRGGSMSPAIPFGSLIFDEPVAVSDLRVGDVITVRADNGVVFSHRVTRLVASTAGPSLEVKGDANATPDPVLVSARAVIGRVVATVPLLGYVAAMLATPIGLTSLLAMLLAGLCLIWLVEELEGELSWREGKRGPASSEGSPRGTLA